MANAARFPSARRTHHRVDERVSAYQLHSWFVDMMTSANDVSKLVDKTLEKRHARAASSFARGIRTLAQSEAEGRLD